MQDVLRTLLSSEQPTESAATVCEAPGLPGAELDSGWSPDDVSGSAFLWTLLWLSGWLTVSPSSLAAALLKALCLETSPSSSTEIGSFVFTVPVSVSLNVTEDNDSGTSCKRNPEKASVKKRKLQKYIRKLMFKMTKTQVLGYEKLLKTPFSGFSLETF